MPTRTINRSTTWPALLALLLLTLVAGCNEGEALSAGERHQSSDSATQSDEDSDPLPHREHSDSSNSEDAPTLSWNAPLSRANGDKLYPGEIAGYRLYYRSNDDTRARVIEIEGSSRTSHTLDDMRPGEYHFSITTQDTNGLESARSEEVAVSIL